MGAHLFANERSLVNKHYAVSFFCSQLVHKIRIERAESDCCHCLAAMDFAFALSGFPVSVMGNFSVWTIYFGRQYLGRAEMAS